MTSEFIISVGTARIQLTADVQRNKIGNASITVIFDDALHAVSRLANATLGTDDSDLVMTAISNLRKHLHLREDLREKDRKEEYDD